MYRYRSLALLFSALCASTGFAHSPALEALGLPQETRALIVHADDVGMCYAAHAGSIEAMLKGSVSSGSVMMPCSWAPATIQACKEHPELDMGVHLDLTNEWKVYRWGPVAGANLVPKLVNDEGYLWPGVMDVYRSVGDSIDQVEIEIQAQIDLARKLGLEATHIDSHMGTLYYNEAFFKATCNLALKNDLPFMAFNVTDDVMSQAQSLLPFYDKAMVEKLKAAGFPLLDGFEGQEFVGETYEEGFQNYVDYLTDLKPGVNLLILHLGIDSEEFKHVTGRHSARDQQYRIFTDPKMAEFLKRENIQLLTWRELKQAIWDKRDKSIEKVFE